MEIRHGEYTYYDDIEMLMVDYYGHGISNPEIENHRKISYNIELGKLDGFELDYEVKRFFRDIHIDELNNAFKVETKGIYKNEVFSLWGYNKKRNVIGLITHNVELAEKHKFLKLSDRYIKEVHPEELSLIWEERSKSEYDLPMPEEIEKRKVIYRNDNS